MTKPIVIYTGPSTLDGAPIVALASRGSTNRKTGPMIQTWILRADVVPHVAVRDGRDASVCGSCPRRRYHGKLGDCYVLVHNAPSSAWKAWERAGKPAADLDHAARMCERDARAYGVRFGAYGDPAAVPWRAWEAFLRAMGARSSGPVRDGSDITRTGYTHHWRGDYALSDADAYAQHDWCRRNLMASCDSVSDRVAAASIGFRAFTALDARLDDEPNTLERALAIEGVPPSVQCLADRPGSTATCATCGICDGSGVNASRRSRASVWIAAHGIASSARIKRAAGLVVLP